MSKLFINSLKKTINNIDKIKQYLVQDKNRNKILKAVRDDGKKKKKIIKN